MPADWAELLPLLGVLATTGLVAGFAAGLLGVGGGIVTVPVLEYSLRFAQVPEEYRMHVAVATSLAAIIPTSISSTRAHHARGAVDWDLARRWALPMLLSAFAGSLLASHASMAVLAGVFGVVALLVAARMLLPLDHVAFAARLPAGVGGAALAAAIGSISAVMGIGGGTLAVPTLTLCGHPIHRAVGTAAFFGLLISVPGSLGYLLAGRVPGLPWHTVGFVSLIGLLLIAPGAMLAATWGARAAHALSKWRLAQAFGAFLLVVGARMLYRALT